MSVTNGNDSGPGSLRQAVLDAPSGGTIIIDESVEVITLASTIERFDQLTIIGTRTPYTRITFSQPFFGTVLLQINEIDISNLYFEGDSGVLVGGILGGGYVHDCTFRYWAVSEIGSQTGPLVVERCEFLNGTSSVNIYVTNENLVVRDCNFVGINSSGNVGIRSSNDLEVTRCLFDSNVVELGGGFIGVMSAGNNVTISECVFQNNSALESTVIGIRLASDEFEPTFTISDCVFYNNVTTGNMSVNGILMETRMTAALNIIRCTFADSQAMYNLAVDTMDITNVNVLDSTFSANATTAIILASTESLICTMTNCTITEAELGILCDAPLVNQTLYNVTIAGNTAGIDVGTGAVSLYNTIVANDVSDIVGNVTGANNIVRNGTGMTGLSVLDGNQIGVDPLLGSLANYGGPTQTMPPLTGSPAINAGNNTYVAQIYDQRGSPFVRIYDSIVDIGAFETQPFATPCFHGKSLVLVRERSTNMRMLLRASDVKASKHDVFDLSSCRFTPVLHNCVIQGATRLYKISKGLLGVDRPYNDLLITSGHPVDVNGKPVKARDVEGAVLIKTEPTNVYSIVTKTWCPIEVNGIGVYAWSEHKWFDRVKQQGIVWSENK